MFFGDYNSHAVPYFVSSSFLSLDLLYFKSVAILMHDISNSLTATNTIYLTYLLPNLIFIHIIQYHLQEVTIMLNTKSFSRYGVNIHDTLLQILSEENDYIDLPS